MSIIESIQFKITILYLKISKFDINRYTVSVEVL